MSAKDHPLARAFVAALAAMDLPGRVREALPPLPPPHARVRVIAVGKAAPAMAEGALARWPKRIEGVLVIAPDGTASPLEDPRVELMRSSHPLPDARSVAAADRALAFARGEVRDLVVVLVSGGASALVCAPSRGVTLEDKRACVAALLGSGASIAEVNTVRRHLSRIKGGGLARAALPGRTLALLASDVIKGGPHDIGSGPTTVDPTTIDDTRAVLRARVPALAGLPLVETLKAGDPVARRQRAHIVASPDDLASLVARELARARLEARVLPASIAEASKLAAEYAELSRSLSCSLGEGQAFVRAAEPALAVPKGASGNGGRASHLAALVAPHLAPGTAFLAAASDGVDGSSTAAGALVDAAWAAGIDPARYRKALEAFDTATLHGETGSALVLGPTGLNFTDVHVLARMPAPTA